MYSSVKNIHFVGIGGIGMSGIAEILINQGFNVSGSDLLASQNTKYLEKLGTRIVIGHNEDNIKDAEVIVYSSAVNPETNPETLAASRNGLPILRRAEMLAEVSKLNYCLAISGTHGKTTTTSICGLVLMKAGLDPTVIVGGKLKGLGGTNARLGDGEWTVVEADEYDRSFLQLFPTIAIINNIEEEHLDIYENFDDLKNTFSEFANKTPFYGLVTVCLDDPGVKDVLPNIKKKVITYGLSKHSDITATNISYSENHSIFTVVKYGKEIGQISIKIPGEHNIRNSLAAITVSLELGISFDVIKAAIEEFTGVYRRFEFKGVKNRIKVYDDYAHHPTEIRATLNAIRKGWDNRLICIFQPHTYSRTKTFFKDFGRSFDDADILIVTDIYPAREKPIEGITGKLISDYASHSGHKNVIYVEDKNNVNNILKDIVEQNDIVITMGAGDIWKMGEEFLKS